MMMTNAARSGTARDLNTRRSSKGLQTLFILLICLGLYGLVTNVNPSRLQQYLQTSYSEGEQGVAVAGAANNNIAADPSNLRAGAVAETSNTVTQESAAVGEAEAEEKGVTNEPSSSPTHEPSYEPSYFPTNSESVCSVQTDEDTTETIDSLPSIEFHEQRCELLKRHMSGHWKHYFSSYNNLSTVIQNDPSIEKLAFPVTDELMNDPSIRLMHLSEEMDWLQGKGIANFSTTPCRTVFTDVGRGISYWSSIGNQCGCRLEEFQPTFSNWLADDESKYELMKKSPSVRLARRFARKNQTVCFVGDSVDLQFYYGFKNNLHRAETLHQEHCGSSFLNISSKQYPAHYSTNGTYADRKQRHRMADDFWMLMREVFETKVIFDDTRDEFRFMYLQHYLYAPWTYEYMNSCDIIMMNEALHYKLPPPDDEFFSDIMAAITYLANFTAANDKVAIWRSALPTHFDTPNGHYPADHVVIKCVGHNDEYILKEGNELQEYTKMHKKAFAKLCQTDTSSCGQLTHTCTVDTKSTDLFTVYAYWVANNMTDELERHKDAEAIVTGTIHNWPLFDLFDTPMWHHSSGDCTHFCYVPALFEEAFKRLDLLLSGISSKSQETREEVPSTMSNDVTH